MIEHKFYISQEGDAFIESQIKKSISFFIYSTLTLFIISLFTVLNKEGVDENRIVLGATIFLVMFLFNLRLFIRGNKVRGHLIKEIIVDEQTISLAVYSSLNKSEKSYRFNRKGNALEKGIAKESNKQINIFDVADTYTLRAEASEKKHFYFISSYWLEWSEIKRIIDNEQS